MGDRESPASPGLRVILCIKFDSRAPAGEVAELRRRLIEDGRSVQSLDVSGSFDFMMEVALPSLADYQAWTEEFASAFASLVDHQEANFVCRRYSRDESGPIHHLWVSGRGGLARVECDQIERFSAEGDYVRAHSGNQSWLINTSLAKLEDELDPAEFIRLHRSTIARRDAIVRLRHHRQTWFAVLNSGNAMRIAKSQVAKVLRSIRDDSSAPHAVSATGQLLSENSVALTED
jgi:hypothetical protein